MKKLFKLSVALIITAALFVQLGCKDESNDPLPDITAVADTIYGTVKLKQVVNNTIELVKWPYGPAMIRAGYIANTALSSDGTFMMILPQTVAGSNFMSMAEYASNQGGTCTPNPENTNFVETVQFTVDYTDNGYAKSMAVNLYLYVLMTNKPIVSKSYAYQFYDRDGTFTGTNSFNKVYDWRFSKGWGMVETYYNTSAETYATKSVSSAPDEAIWTNL